MQYPYNVKSMHLELSDRCQASCPMCPRNAFGGEVLGHITNTDITLEQVKEWFPTSFLMSLDHIFSCGNNGDPLMAKDCLEIYEYFRDNTHSECQLDIHTNGSLRSKAWWTKLGGVLGKRGHVVFAIDGFADTHSIYRRGTDFDKIIDNAKTFIAAGGRARAECIIFKHNEHQAEELEKFLYSIGFEHVHLKPTMRFYGTNQFPVNDRTGKFEYFIQPAEGARWNNNLPQPNFVKLVDKKVYQQMLDNAVIEPKCLKGSELFVSCRGQVYPCCWVGSGIEGSKYVEVQSPEEGIIRDRLSQSMHDLMNDIGIIDLNTTDIETGLKNSGWDTSMHKHVTTEPKLVCVKSCGKNFSQIIN